MAVAAVSKDTSAITVMTPVQRGHWRGCNDGKDASNRDRQQPAGATKGQEGGQEEWVGGRDARRSAVKGLLPLTGDIPSRGCCAIRNSRDDLPGCLEGQWQRRWMPWRCDEGRRTTYDDAVEGVRHYPQRRVNRQALLRRWEANNAAPLRWQLLHHREPDAARGEEARRACAKWPGPPGSNRTQQSNLGRHGGRGEILLHATIKLRPMAVSSTSVDGGGGDGVVAAAERLSLQRTQGTLFLTVDAVPPPPPRLATRPPQQHVDCHFPFKALRHCPPAPATPRPPTDARHRPHAPTIPLALLPSSRWLRRLQTFDLLWY